VATAVVMVAKAVVVATAVVMVAIAVVLATLVGFTLAPPIFCSRCK